MKKIIFSIKQHKIISAIILLVLAAGGFWGYGKLINNGPIVSYQTAAVEKGTLITSVSGSGQISVSNQVDIKAKVAGEIIKIAAVSGQPVKTGDLIAQLDTRDANKTVRDARTNLESAQLAYDKLVQPATADEKLQAQNAVNNAQASLDKLKLSQPVDFQNAQDDLQTANNNLTKTYTDAFGTISGVYLNLPNIMISLDDILYSDTISKNEVSVARNRVNITVLADTIDVSDQAKNSAYESVAVADYATARKIYDENYQDFKNSTVYSDTATIEKLLTATLATTKAIAQAVKSQNNYLNYWADSRTLYNLPVFSQVTTYLNNLSTFINQTNSGLSNLLAAQASIQSGKEAITSAENTLKSLKQNQPLDLAAAEASLQEKRAAFASLLAGVDPLDLRSQRLTLEQRRNSLLDAQAELADYTIRAPFDGVIATVSLKVGDSASGAAIATLITAQKIAEISLNEVDVAKIQVGDKVTLTFDAIENLTISGQVTEIDSIGTVSQGVVTYNVKIGFDAQDQRIKSGMSTSAVIITDVKTDVLMVSNSAVKSDNNGGNYVQTLNAGGQPQRVDVQVGLVNDTDTEITGGLSEGDNVVVQTITSGSTSAPAPSGSGQNRNSGFGGFGATRIIAPPR